MKKLFLLSFALMLGFMSFHVQGAEKGKDLTSAKVEIYYFHFTRRCITCNAVEAESKKAIEALYPALVKSGQISFKGLNLDDNSSKSQAKKCGAEGQSLLVIGGNKRIDLTSQGFMYARNNPEKLKAELKNAIDPMIK
ncbi:MAG: nitrophenyl compound nitroreductase subunit ArsF family protein [Bacteroidales bacterium]|nr:nitrophenyl compound nitroreductase subunit ArsF family protein [Bacteroidales bacterium]